jgi:hypothetical protein
LIRELKHLSEDTDITLFDFVDETVEDFLEKIKTKNSPVGEERGCYVRGWI